MFSHYSLSTSPIPGAPSPNFSPPGQEHQNILQPTQQYYMMMSPPSYSLTTASMPGIGQAHQIIQQPAEQYYTMSMLPLSAVNMTSRAMISRPSQTDFPGSSTSANLGDRSLAPTSRTHIVNSPNGNTTICPFGFTDDPSSHVANMSIEATVHSSSVSYGSEAASAHSFSTYNYYTQSNGAMIENAAWPRFPTAEPVPLTLNGVPMVPKNAPGLQSTYMHPAVINMNQYTGYPSHNSPSLHSSQYRNTVTGNNFSSSSSLQMTHLPQYVPNTDFAPSSSYPKSFVHDFGTQHGSQPAGPPYQPAPSMAPPPPTHLQQDPPRSNTHTCLSFGRHRETHSQDANASSSITLYCNWLDEDDTLCPFQGSLEDLEKHLTSSHLSGAQNASGRCRWQGCLKENMQRDSIWRHVQETHLNMKRGT